MTHDEKIKIIDNLCNQIAVDAMDIKNSYGNIDKQFEKTIKIEKSILDIRRFFKLMEPENNWSKTLRSVI